MLTVIFVAGACIVYYPSLHDFAALARRKSHARMDRATAHLIQAAGDVVLVVANVLWREWPWAIVFGVLALAELSRWWRRRKRKRTLATLGNKAKARIEAMKQAMRERAKPRPVLRPGLQGAR